MPTQNGRAIEEKTADLIDLIAYVRNHVDAIEEYVRANQGERALASVARAEIRLDQLKRELFKF